MEQQLTALRPQALGLLRIVLGLLMLNVGIAKILHFPAGGYTPDVGSLSWIAGLIEMVGGALLLVGFQTRIAAFVLSGLMACAYFIAHFPNGFFPNLNNGGYSIALCFAFLYLVTAGSGAFALDSRR